MVEVKTGRNELRAAQMKSYLDLARQEGFDAVLTISNQLVTAPGEHPVTVDGRRMRRVSLHHLSWSQVYTEALIEQGNRSVADPDQAWILRSSSGIWAIHGPAPSTLTTWAPREWRFATPRGLGR